MNKSDRVLLALTMAAVAVVCIYPINANADPTPYVATGLSSFGGSTSAGVEEPSVLYYPATDTFVTDPAAYTNIVDEGGGMIRETLRNYYSTLGWWDGDRATTSNDRQRAEVKNLGGSGYASYRQLPDETYEYSYDFRTNPEFVATSNFCHIFQLKGVDGDNGSPLVTLSLYKVSGVTTGVLQYSSSVSGGFVRVRNFTFTPGEWHHAVIRISTTTSTETNGVVMASINGDTFTGASGMALYDTDTTKYYNKWGLYRSISTSNGVPAGDSWVEDRTVTLLEGTTNILKWQGGTSGNAWDLDTTSNFLNGATADIFRTADQVKFDDSTANNTVNLTSSVLSPNYTLIDAAQNYTFSGTGKIHGGTVVKKGTGTLTLATNNDYPGLTQVQNGTLYVTGGIGNNSLAWITGGTFKAGSSSALGSNNTIGTTIKGGTLDINGQNLSTEPITVEGAGVSGNGAIVNTGASQTNALKLVTLTGDTTFGGSGRWDISGGGAILSTGGNTYNLTKTGTNQISLVGTTVDTHLGNININQGILSFQSSATTMGDSTKTVTIASGAVLGFYEETATMNKKAVLNGSTIWAESGTGSKNTFSGAITVNGAGGIFNAGGALTGGTPNASAVLNLSGAIGGTGGVTTNGPGTVFFSGTNTYQGGTTISGSGTLSVANNNNLGSAAGGVIFNGGRLAATGAVAMARPFTTTANGGGIDTSSNIVSLSGAQNTTWGAGTLTVDGTTGGKLQFNRGGGTVSVNSNATLQINAGATVELSGTSATYDGTNALNVVNNSTGSLLISATNQVLGDITGTGNTILANNASLTATKVVQHIVKIGSGAKLTIASLTGGGAQFATSQVPEPATIVLLAMAGLAGLLFGIRRVKIRS